LADGRLLVASVPIDLGATRVSFHLLVVFAALAIGVAAFPVVRQLTGRLERLQRGVDSLGAGDLGARVAVEGRDEIARLAESFNRAAGQIEQLIHANRSLLANASHELRTPLARIRLSVEMLKQSADPKAKAGLEQDIAELDDLVDEILLASRLNTVAQHEVREEVDLLALAAEECARYDEVQLEGEHINIQGDPRLLRRLLRNLLENARRHGIPPTQVRLQQTGGTVTLRVWDSGPGPKPEEFEQLFTPFYRRRDSHNSTGNGLGLSLVRQIARRHGGDARCLSMDDGRSCFSVTLDT
jgi:signal transduction histidine kinase